MVDRSRFKSAIAASLAFAAILFAQSPSPVSVQLLAINDFHGNLEPPAGSDGQVNGVPAGGAEYLATHLRAAARANPNSVLVAAGDLIGALPLISSYFQDKPAIEAMNAMDLAVTSIGNHELDNGPAELRRRTADARFQYLAANVVKSDDPQETLFPATAVRTIAGVKIGFIGEVLEGTDRMIAPSSSKGLSFLEESRVANAAAARLERDGVHAIVLLIHQGGYQHPAAGAPDTNGCDNFDGDINRVVNKLSPSIKVVISGHTHVFYNCVISGHVVTSAGSYGRLFTRVNLSIDPATDRILSVTAKNEVVTRDVEKDPAQSAIIGKYLPDAEKVARKPVGAVRAPIGRNPNEAGESALGDVIADAQLAATRAPEQGGAEIAFMNSGGIRAVLEGKGAERAITWGDLYAAQPFHNRLTVVTMTGDMIRRLLEQQFRDLANPYIIQVSAGFAYRYKLNAPAGQHVVAGSMTLNGHPIAPDQKLRVEASDFLTTGGDSFSVFREATNLVGGPSDLDALVEYFTQHSPVEPGLQNRIVRVD